MKNIGFYFLTRTRKSRSWELKKSTEIHKRVDVQCVQKLLSDCRDLVFFELFGLKCSVENRFFKLFFECLIERQIHTTGRADRRRRKNFCDFDLDLGILTH